MTEVSDEMVRAAYEALTAVEGGYPSWEDLPDDRRGDVRSAIAAALAARPSPTGEKVEADAVANLYARLDAAWTDFLDANPDDLTSPEDLPDHALMTGAQFTQYASAGIIRTLAALVAERDALAKAYDSEKTASAHYRDLASRKSNEKIDEVRRATTAEFTLAAANARVERLEREVQTLIYRLCLMEGSQTLNSGEKELIRKWVIEARAALEPPHEAP